MLANTDCTLRSLTTHNRFCCFTIPLTFTAQDPQLLVRVVRTRSIQAWQTHIHINTHFHHEVSHKSSSYSISNLRYIYIGHLNTNCMINQPGSKWEQSCPLGITQVAGTSHTLLRQIAVEFQIQKSIIY
jgi:hypothetical protein